MSPRDRLVWEYILRQGWTLHEPELVSLACNRVDEFLRLLKENPPATPEPVQGTFKL